MPRPKWTPERLAKFRATMAAKSKKPKNKAAKHDASKTMIGTNHHDAVIYLRHTEREIYKTIGATKKLGTEQLYTLLALNALQGKS